MRARIVTVVAAAAALLSMPAVAALPPQYQRAAELRAVIDATVDVLGIEHPIERIELVEPDLYRVTSGPCQVDARIVDKPQASGMVGPRQFEVQPGNLVCQ